MNFPLNSIIYNNRFINKYLYLYCNGYVQIMNKKASVNITTILTITAILIVTVSALQLSHAQTNLDIQNAILSIHNRERGEVLVSPLSWSNSLAADAQSWADHIVSLGLSASQKAPHAPFDMNNPQGENLAWGTKGWFTATIGAQSWADEKSNYVKGTPIPPYTPGQTGPVTGHYTQMVWKETTQIGCATASDADRTYLVCRYSPPGNYEGQVPY
jgi:Cysteine-rich secretory protein family